MHFVTSKVLWAVYHYLTYFWLPPSHYKQCYSLIVCWQGWWLPLWEVRVDWLGQATISKGALRGVLEWIPHVFLFNWFPKVPWWCRGSFTILSSFANHWHTAQPDLNEPEWLCDQNHRGLHLKEVSLSSIVHLMPSAAIHRWENYANHHLTDALVVILDTCIQKVLLLATTERKTFTTGESGKAC